MIRRIYPHDRLLAATLLKLVPRWVTPNQITILRMLMTPFVVWVLYLQRYEWGTPLFLLVSLTDMIDGSLARTRHHVTEWGTLWDPVADKLLVGAVAVLLLFRNFPPALTAMILGLEGAFLIGGYLRKRQGEIVSANWWGKFKMLCQVFGLAFFLLYLQTDIIGFAWASYATFGLAALLAINSLVRHGL